MHLDFIKIKLLHPTHQSKESHQALTSSIEQDLKQVIPEELLMGLAPSRGLPKDTFIAPLVEKLPLISFDFICYDHHIFCARILSSAEFTQGLGRFFTETLARQLFPGKIFSFFLVQGASFNFLVSPKTPFFFFQCCVDLENPANVKVVRQHLAEIKKHIHITTLSVMHSRKLVASKKLSVQEKHMVLVENLMSLTPSSEKSQDLFDTSFHLLSKAQEEMGPPHIQSAPTSNESSAELFDHNIFRSIYKSTTTIFDQKEMLTYPMNYLNKVVSYHYLMEKMHKHAILNKKLLPDSIKVLTFKTRQEGMDIWKLGVLVLFVRDSLETFPSKTVLTDQITNFQNNICLEKLQLSFSDILGKKIAFLYFDLKKADGISFSLDEVKQWKTVFFSYLNRENKHLKNHQYDQEHHPEEFNSFLAMREQQRLSGQAMIHALFSSRIKQGFLVTLMIMSSQEVSAQSIREVSRNTWFDIHSYQKKIIALNHEAKPVYYHRIKIALSKKSYLSVAENLDEAIAEISLAFKQLFGPLNYFSPEFLKQCPQKLVLLKKLLPLYVPKAFIENVYFNLTPSSHRLTLSIEHLKNFILFIYENVWQLTTPNSRVTHVHSNMLWLMTNARFMRAARLLIRKAPFLSITELYTVVEQTPVFVAIIKCHDPDGARTHLRTLVDNKVQSQLSKRIGLKRGLKETLSLPN